MPKSQLEQQFLGLWLQHSQALHPDVDWPDPVAQVRPVPPRKFLLDFAWPELRVGVEVHGDTWSAQRGQQRGHTSGKGIRRDCEKLNLTQAAGWLVMQYTSDMLRDERNTPGSMFEPLFTALLGRM